MNTFKRSFLSIIRNKKSSLSLLLILIILSFIYSGALSLKQAYTKNESNIKNKLPLTATIINNYTEQEDYLSNNPDNLVAPIKLEKYKKIGDLEYVKEYDYSEYDVIQSNKLKSQRSIADIEIEERDWTNTFLLKGVNNNKIFDIISSKITLEEGRSFSKREIESSDNVTIVSKKFAEENNLALNEVFSLDRVFSIDDAQKEHHIGKYQIIGIFDTKKKVNEPKNDFQFEELVSNTRSSNTLYIPNKNLVSRRTAFYEDQGLEIPSEEYDAYYELKDVKYTESFRQEAENILGTKFYNVIISTDQYNSINPTFVKLKKIVDNTMILMFITSISVISLSVILLLRDRKYEFGVYLSLGEKKLKIISLIMIEILTIATVAVSISVFPSHLAAKELSYIFFNNVEEEEWTIEKETEVQQYNSLGNSVIDVEQTEENFEVSISKSKILTAYFFIIFVIIMSMIIPMIYIFMINPKKLLLDR